MPEPVLDQLGSYRKTDRDPLPVEGSAEIITLELPNNGAAYDEASDTTQIEGDDGSIVIAFGPPEPERRESDSFGENLAERLSAYELSTVAERLLKGIEVDEQSRAEWLENTSSGLSLLGVDLKNPKGAATAAATPSEGVSNVDHPLLLEAVLRFQANAMGELLPADGPVKVRNDGEGNALSTQLATALEKDLNYYLTKVAREYYPDTDRMLLMLGFSGMAFKKGYHDPIKRRPVIKSIDAKDLIVSNATASLDDSGRVTHRIMMRPSLLKRMQLVGAYRNVALPAMGTPPVQNPVDEKVASMQGIAPAMSVEAEDVDRELYECYCEIDLPGFEHLDGEDHATGLPLPYKVVIDKDSRQILEIRRNWLESDPLYMPRNRIIAYTFIPGMGFYGLGLLNVLGNATKAVTAAWRLLLDAGMFATFPGFLYIKQLANQMTNQMRVAPGTGVGIDTMGADIRTQVMPLPYKDPSAVFIQLIDNIAATAQRVGGTAEMAVGEGRQDAPVGTTLALMEQAVKLMSAVHKRAHMAQSQEFELLLDLLKEDPEALWRHNKRSAVQKRLHAAPNDTAAEAIEQQQEQAQERQKQLFLAALEDYSLVPRADPNTSSQTERYLKVVALRQMAQSNQNMDINAVDQRALSIMGIDDAQTLFKPAPPPGAGQPAPEQVMAQATATAAQARLTDAETRKQEVALRAATEEGKARLGAALKLEGMASAERVAALGVAKELVSKQSSSQEAMGAVMRELDEAAQDRVHQRDLALLNSQTALEEARIGAHSQHQQGLANIQSALVGKIMDHGIATAQAKGKGSS